MADTMAICTSCGAPKDLPLARCGACGHLPTGEDRALAVICSTRMLGAGELAEVQARIRRGEPLRPSAVRREQAQALLSGTAPVPARLTNGQLMALFVVNLLLTPLLGYAVWFRYRSHAGPAARQALLVTVPASALLLVLLLTWRWWAWRGFVSS